MKQTLIAVTMDSGKIAFEFDFSGYEVLEACFMIGQIIEHIAVMSDQPVGEVLHAVQHAVRYRQGE